MAIVSDVGSGPGRQLACSFARAGAAVVLAARDDATVAAVHGEVAGHGGPATGATADLTDPTQCDRLVQAALDAFGHLDVLVHTPVTPDPLDAFDTADLGSWRRTMDVTLFGSLQLTRAAIPPMRTQGGGAIVFVNSPIIRQALAHHGADAAANGALLTAAQVLARELGAHHIRVNSLVPRPREAPPRAGSAAARGDGPPPPLPVEALSDDAWADAAVFLASDLAAVVTGQTLEVTGGVPSP